MGWYDPAHVDVVAGVVVVSYGVARDVRGYDECVLDEYEAVVVVVVDAQRQTREDHAYVNVNAYVNVLVSE